jgi:hypothetical protein
LGMYKLFEQNHCLIYELCEHACVLTHNPTE